MLASSSSVVRVEVVFEYGRLSRRRPSGFSNPARARDIKVLGTGVPEVENPLFVFSVCFSLQPDGILASVHACFFVFASSFSCEEVGRTCVARR